MKPLRLVALAIALLAAACHLYTSDTGEPVGSPAPDAGTTNCHDDGGHYLPDAYLLPDGGSFYPDAAVVIDAGSAPDAGH